MLYLAFALKYAADLVGPQIASVSLTHSLWLPLLICGLCLLASLAILAALPETLSLKHHHSGQMINGPEPAATSFEGYRSLLSDRKILAGMSITFLTQFRYLNESVLLPYASVRFSWSIGQVSPFSNTSIRHSTIFTLGLPAPFHHTGSLPNCLLVLTVSHTCTGTTFLPQQRASESSRRQSPPLISDCRRSFDSGSAKHRTLGDWCVILARAPS